MVTVKLETVAAVTDAVVLLTFTMLSLTVGEKLVPVMVTLVPTAPEVGENPVIVGSGITGESGLSLSLHPLHSKKKKRLSITFFMSSCIIWV